MPKRKREETDLDQDHKDDDRALRIRKSRLVAQVDQGNILLHRALKVARGFERQKLGRRQKAAKENPQALLRLKEEVIVLKQLDLAETAQNYLFKQLVRTKRIREAPAFVALHGEGLESKVKGARAGAEANVVGRLMNSNPVKEVLPGIMSKVYRCLGLAEVPVATKVKNEIEGDAPPGHLEVRRFGSETDSRTSSNWEGLSPTGADHDSGVSAAKSRERCTAEYDDLVAASLDSQFVDSNGGMARYGHALASSSASGHSSDGEEDETSRNRMFDVDRRLPADRAPSLSPSSSLSLSRSPSPPPSNPTTLPHLKPPIPAPPPQPRTTFLPSLTLGGYFSGSDTDSKSNSSSNSDVNQFRKRNSQGPTAALPQPRRNRRGQRARQQIAEKKYGRAAKHLQKQQQQVHTMRSRGQESAVSRHRDEGWDVRKGATTSEGASYGRSRASGRQEGRRFGLGSKGPTGANNEAITGKDRTQRDQNNVHDSTRVNGNAEGPLHPSWEAAKKRKAQTQKVTALFQGKKITF
ncbi:hypothetical protein EPUS_04227 [Endocarpon pusillum Z07020]|uniref:Bud22 domain-containing protein n=1 Tax=Endocarpon pusillum (strain Z07020 / HMAS-L-300199) TaxID=1263415 RepID=U1G612_ENDPU|nr:uncharacterized protein EPUS_04227 [Endocarpon pusillum Z07020]ERF72792.1 hypothetical protein EPUS_04227 [Endocarpon pusillum Z07020]